MREGYNRSGGEDGAYAELDEFLCEYVDGTMDAAVRAAFEEYLRLNPSLNEHVECLRATRSMLCRYGCRLRAPAALQQRLRERLGEEMMDSAPVMPQVADRLTWIAGFSSLLLLVCGSLVANHMFNARTEVLDERVVESAAERRAVEPVATLDLLSPAAAFSPAPLAVRRVPSRTAQTVDITRSDSFLTTVRPLRPMLQTAALP